MSSAPKSSSTFLSTGLGSAVVPSCPEVQPVSSETFQLRPEIRSWCLRVSPTVSTVDSHFIPSVQGPLDFGRRGFRAWQRRFPCGPLRTYTKTVRRFLPLSLRVFRTFFSQHSEFSSFFLEFQVSHSFVLIFSFQMQSIRSPTLPFQAVVVRAPL